MNHRVVEAADDQRGEDVEQRQQRVALGQRGEIAIAAPLRRGHEVHLSAQRVPDAAAGGSVEPRLHGSGRSREHLGEHESEAQREPAQQGEPRHACRTGEPGAGNGAGCREQPIRCRPVPEPRQEPDRDDHGRECENRGPGDARGRERGEPRAHDEHAHGVRGPPGERGRAGLPQGSAPGQGDDGTADGQRADEAREREERRQRGLRFT